jgi:hypothetical protein
MSGKASTPPVPPRGKTPTPAPARPTTPAEAAGASPHRTPTKNGAPVEDDIRARAYSLWEEAGHPEGDGVEFWLRAERDLTAPR